MALKDTWKDLENAIEGVAGSGDDISVEPINDIAHAVIENEDVIKKINLNDIPNIRKDIQKINEDTAVFVEDVYARIADLPTKPYVDEVVEEAIKNTGGGGSIVVDSEMSNTSTNPVENKVIKEYVDNNIYSIGATITGVNKTATQGKDIAETALTKAETALNVANSLGNTANAANNNANAAMIAANKALNQIGDIETALDTIISIQEELIG